MANDQKPDVKAEKKKKGMFPILSLIVSIAVIIMGLLDFLNVYSLSRDWLIVLFFFAGVWLFFQSMSIGFARKRNEILKKFM